ncbi:5-formyltetrahydrofolate cyclo-ligase [Clostridium sp. NSJ-6]|uniref:5-formyltetrahydrofolate cyclo-ligase n=1 Tax=Clostridium hominis TaxID=2763036 RepID=A0ABR7DJZ2_9CLOT|nr:5-formyltetrahydrofolate cyclo-ligase [Clostridium hominis]MBC5630983.1 5-formyltetrahydrofolate cyclo-ligase [Clostridium hominis]MDU2673685.1 5-formyltetrahydrofolate cyclo-ligase [Clostridium sp.]
MDKKIIRKSVLKLRRNIKDEERGVWDKSIFDLLVNSKIYKDAQSIFIYVSCKDEVDTKEIIDYSLKNDKAIYVPKINIEDKTMKAIRIHSLNELYVNKYGILEPNIVDKNYIDSDFDLIVLPGIAFDKVGNRIGYGGGYYDKYLSVLECRINKVALAYGFQVLDNIEYEDHDIRVDYIITNKQLITI